MKPFYERGGITIYCGDCLEVMLRLESSFDAIIADLPYGTTACAWDVVIPFEPLWQHYKRVIKRNGAVVLFGSQPFTSMLVMSNPNWFKYEWVWLKNRGGSFALAKYRPMKEHESVLIFSQSKEKYYPIMQDRSGGGLNRVAYKLNGSTDSDNYGNLKPKFIKQPDELRFPSSWQKFNIETGLHPTQKPVALLEYLIRTYTNEGELILDNTMGSGTTLVAAQNEGRRAVGIEINESYCRIAVDRLRQPSFFSIPAAPAPLFVAQPEQISLFTEAA
jgi:site-specific DNA-methyltransferase (adenine-specific)